MPVHKKNKLKVLGIPDVPPIAREFLKLNENKKDLESAVNELIIKYPQFFQRLLKIINSDHINLTTKVNGLYQAISLSGFGRISQLVIVQIIYRTFNQYKIQALDMQEFWQDTLRRAVSAKMIGELIGLDADECFTAGFIQDMGFILLFLKQPEKGSLWNEFRKRDPDARLSMEHNVFNLQHNEELGKLMQMWNIFPQLKNPVVQHHNSENVNFNELDKQLCKVVYCADWMASVYTASDKSHVINRCRKILFDDFQMEPYRTEALLEAIPDEVDLTARILEIEIKEHIAFSQILFEANIRLNEDNVNFQELTLRLEQALDERDKLAKELNRDLNLAREIQQSLLPENRGDFFPVNGINISAKILSGDFYDFFELDDGSIYFNLGDVSGKGVNAALLMAKTISLFRCLGKRISEPGLLMHEINNELCETSIHGMFVTMVSGLYFPEKDEIHLVNAGNPPALLFLESGICQEFEASAPPLGVMPNTIYTEYIIKLKGGSLYVYSDGVTEGFVDENSTLELSGLFKMIANLDSAMPASKRLNVMVEKFTNTTKPLRDDLTLLLLENKKHHA
ncbi:Serine phosphatase RsbU, regulator of sigma subunit [hydrothermal vent metagenome]|uniref:Serine phosphatase RsbU, regulator of sigma subunit n=1 Tax=hydrothermal vent metagenome TaxID=652676 RepID=A0A3B0XDV0_9ZZZZ